MLVCKLTELFQIKKDISSRNLHTYVRTYIHTRTITYTVRHVKFQPSIKVYTVLENVGYSNNSNFLRILYFSFPSVYLNRDPRESERPGYVLPRSLMPLLEREMHDR